MDDKTKKVETTGNTYACKDCNSTKKNGSQIKYQNSKFLGEGFFDKEGNPKQWNNDSLTWIQDLCKPCGEVRLLA
jgi:hypothetical protein